MNKKAAKDVGDGWSEWNAVIRTRQCGRWLQLHVTELNGKQVDIKKICRPVREFTEPDEQGYQF